MLENLRTFITVIEQRNFSRAAELLHITQPTVSAQIRNLEKTFACPLLYRSSKQALPTQAGEILYTNAKKVLTLMDETHKDIQHLTDQIGGTLRIGSSYTIGEYILPRVLASFKGDYPQVNLDVVTSNTKDTVKLIHSNQIDIGLIEGEIDQGGLVEFAFMEDEMIVVVPTNHPLAARSTVKGKELQDQIWVKRELGSGTRSYTDQYMKQLELYNKQSYVFNSNQGVIEAVAAGLGVAFVSKFIVKREIETGRLVPLNILGKKFVRNFSIIHRKQEGLIKSVEVFISFLKEMKVEWN